MALVLTNGMYFIATNKNGRIVKTSQVEEAQQFYDVNVATRKLQKAPGKCKGYYVINTDRDDKPSNEKQKKRKRYAIEVRQKIYSDADGSCTLCGRKIKFKEMTLDHIVPLALGGVDNVGNLSCTCEACNQFKGSILPDDFMNRITEIFMYQMEKKHDNSSEWRDVHKLLERMI